MDKVDYSSLEEYLIQRVVKVIKRPAYLAYSAKGVFTGEAESKENKSLLIKTQANKLPKAVFIDVLEKDALEYTRAVKTIL